jgi:hypothetical protein
MLPPKCPPETSDSLLLAICQQEASEQDWQRFVHAYGPAKIPGAQVGIVEVRPLMLFE